MAAIFDSTNPASPLHYDASQTALLILDFQSFIINLCGPGGKPAVAKAAKMRNWALSQDMMVLHSIVDVNSQPPSTCKVGVPIKSLLEGLKGDDSEAAKEPTELAFAHRDREYLVLKPSGANSSFKSAGAAELLSKQRIKSLIVCGVSTSGTVLRTAVPATDDDFVVSVISDACADANVALHEVLMEQVLPSRAHVALAEQFIEEWTKAKAQA